MDFCHSCDAETEFVSPPTMDNAAWAEVALLHTGDCVFVRSRGFTCHLLEDEGLQYLVCKDTGETICRI